ncbi:hypothetical protein ACOMHN_022649 [Nucella lapillus]
MWGMDLTMLPKSDEGHNYLVVAVDYLSKYVEAAPLKIKEAPAILTFFDNICSRFGFPKVVITDQGREFCNQLFEDYCNVNGISHRTSTAYHPQELSAADRASDCKSDGPRGDDTNDEWFGSVTNPLHGATQKERDYSLEMCGNIKVLRKGPEAKGDHFTELKDQSKCSPLTGNLAGELMA